MPSGILCIPHPPKKSKKLPNNKNPVPHFVADAATTAAP